MDNAGSDGAIAWISLAQGQIQDLFMNNISLTNLLLIKEVAIVTWKIINST